MARMSKQGRRKLGSNQERANANILMQRMCDLVLGESVGIKI